MKTEESYTIPEAHREFARRTNHRTWDLLDKTDRTPAEDQEMLLAAFASLYHWQQVGTAVHAQRGFWLLSRVCVVLNRPAEAVEFAQKCHNFTADYPDEMEDFDLAFAQEALARAQALRGNLEAAKNHYQQALDLGKRIQDPEDYEIFQNDFQGGDWFILS